MIKQELETLTACEIDNETFDKLNTIYMASQTFTKQDIADLYLNINSECVERFYETCEDIDLSNRYHLKARKELQNEIQSLNNRIDELETELQQYKTLKADITDVLNELFNDMDENEYSSSELSLTLSSYICKIKSLV